jgi:hypothetical protein
MSTEPGTSRLSDVRLRLLAALLAFGAGVAACVVVLLLARDVLG